MNKILTAIHTHAIQAPDKVALIGEKTQLTYAQVSAQINLLSSWLREQKINRLGLWGENSIEWIIADLAAWQADVTLIPLPRFFFDHSIATCHQRDSVTTFDGLRRDRPNRVG